MSYTCYDGIDACVELFGDSSRVRRMAQALRYDELYPQAPAHRPSKRDKLTPCRYDELLNLLLVCSLRATERTARDDLREFSRLPFARCVSPLGVLSPGPEVIPGQHAQRLDFFGALKHYILTPEAPEPLEVAVGRMNPLTPVAWVDTYVSGASLTGEPLRVQLVFQNPTQVPSAGPDPARFFTFIPGRSLALLGRSFRLAEGQEPGAGADESAPVDEPAVPEAAESDHAAA